MKQSKIIIIQDYLKQYQHQPILTINKVKKKKDNFIVNCTIQYKQTIKGDPQGTNTTIQSLISDPTLISYIYEKKTYIIPIKDIQFPIKRKIPKVKKIYLS